MAGNNTVNRFFISRVDAPTLQAIRKRKKELGLDTDREYLNHMMLKDEVKIEDQSLGNT